MSSQSERSDDQRHNFSGEKTTVFGSGIGKKKVHFREGFREELF
jgi:hypothetical protein